jgi:hypothetical protein
MTLHVWNLGTRFGEGKMAFETTRLIDVDGKRYVGSCSIQGNNMTVSYVTAGCKNASIGSTRPGKLSDKKRYVNYRDLHVNLPQTIPIPRGGYNAGAASKCEARTAGP